MNWLLQVLISFVMSALMTYVAYRLAYRRGHRRGATLGRIECLAELRADLDETITEWTKRGSEGEYSRVIELPGIQAVRNMLGRNITDDTNQLRLL